MAAQEEPHTSTIAMELDPLSPVLDTRPPTTQFLTSKTKILVNFQKFLCSQNFENIFFNQKFLRCHNLRDTDRFQQLHYVQYCHQLYLKWKHHVRIDSNFFWSKICKIFCNLHIYYFATFILQSLLI